ncbi:MAG: sugar transferase [bacterium]
MLVHRWQLSCKRLMDLLAASMGVTLLLPVLAVIAAAIKLTSPGPILFRQSRSGLNGRPFQVLKFRTMTTDTRPVVGTETLEDDPRITAVGRFMRKTGLDELPQLFNILRGEMSIVGPRPLLQWENDMCNARERRRLEVKPGITGLSQIHGRNAIPWHARVEWDVRYVERAGIRLDLWILLKTVPLVLFGENAYADPGMDIYSDPANDNDPACARAAGAGDSQCLSGTAEQARR